MHDLIKDGQIIKSREFLGSAPTLSANKGKWLPRQVIKPAHDPKTQTVTLQKTITATHSVWTYVVSDKSLDDIRGERLDELDAFTKDKRDGGTVVNGLNISTDTQAIAELTGALSLMARKPSETISFKLATGWIDVNKAMLDAIQDGIFDHIKLTNSNSKTHYNALMALNDLQAIADYDISTGWQ